jgi:hypothetical protein
MNALVKQFEEHGFKLEINEERIVARCDRVAPRARLGFKNEFYYRFPNVERMYEYVNNFLADRLKAQEMKEKRKVEAKVRAAALAANVKVGDIFVDSWGYEQTNVDFYQVVAKPSAKTVVVREIAFERVEGSEQPHGMACDVRPVPNEFIGEEMKKRIDNYGGFKVNSFSSARPTEADKKHYMSWYG